MGVQSRPSNNGETIRIRRSDGWYVAKDESTGVASQGETKVKALENLAEALELHTRPDPEENEDLAPSTAPWLDN